MKGLSKKEVDKDIPDQLPPQERENSGQQKNDTGGVLNFRMDDYHPIFNSLMTSIQNYKGNSAKSLQPWKQAHQNLWLKLYLAKKAAEAEPPLIHYV